MEIALSFAIVAFAALIHASFQLSISVLTLLSGHAIGSKRSFSRLIRLTTSFVFGAGVMTVLLLSFVALVLSALARDLDNRLIWTIGSGLLFGVGLAVWFFYYRKGRGTALWVPRNVAAFLNERSKATKRSAEAFSLGLTSVLAEILFIVAPLVVSAFALINLDPTWQIAGIGLYAVISLFSLVGVWMLIGSGHRLSQIQSWREQNKHFLQFSAAGGLVVLGCFVYVNEVLAVSVGGS